MLTPADSFSKRLTVVQLLDTVYSAITTGKGLSVIRLGDGEGVLMSWPVLASHVEAGPKLKIWFGEQRFSKADLSKLAQLTRSAIRSADIVGLPTAAQCAINAGYRQVFDAIDHYHLLQTDQQLCDANMHWYLQFSGGIASLLRDRDFVGIIGPRALGDEIEKTFNVQRTETYLVRGEDQFRGTATEPHWPIGFANVCENLRVPYPGAIFLIGAGLLGKAYCALVKEKGGVALDIGSLFDSWAGVPSRRRYRNSPHAYSLAYHQRPIAAQDMRRSLEKHLADLNIESATY